MNEAQRIYGTRPDLSLIGAKEEALLGADSLTVCTDWNAFSKQDFDVVKEHLKHPVIIGGRKLYKPEILEAYGIAYFGIGRGRSFSLRGLYV